jgi:hypothetical protein
VTDKHLRVLRFAALKRQWELHDHDEADHADETASADRRRHLKRMATRARTRFTDAEARRFPR